MSNSVGHLSIVKLVNEIGNEVHAMNALVGNSDSVEFIQLDSFSELDKRN